MRQNRKEQIKTKMQSLPNTKNKPPLQTLANTEQKPPEQRTDNQFELYCPYLSAFRTIRGNSITNAILSAKYEYQNRKSDFELKDLIFVRISTNPVFLLYSIDASGFVARLKSRCHKDYIKNWLDEPEVPKRSESEQIELLAMEMRNGKT